MEKNQMSRLDEIERWLHLREKNEPVPESLVQNIDWLIQKLKECQKVLSSHVEWFNVIKEKQYKLLIEGQDLKSADKNWDEATNAENYTPFDYGPTIELLKSLRGEK